VQLARPALPVLDLLAQLAQLDLLVCRVLSALPVQLALLDRKDLPVL
jgi:hypothetical protein